MEVSPICEMKYAVELIRDLQLRFPGRKKMFLLADRIAEHNYAAFSGGSSGTRTKKLQNAALRARSSISEALKDALSAGEVNSISTLALV